MDKKYNGDNFAEACLLLSELDELGFILACELIEHEYERCLREFGGRDKRKTWASRPSSLSTVEV